MQPRQTLGSESKYSGALVGVHGPIWFRQVPDSKAVHRLLLNSVLNARRDLPDLDWQAAPVQMG